MVEVETRQDLPKESFTLEAFILQWNILLKKLNEEGKSAAIGAIKNVEIQKKSDERVEFLFHSNAAKSEFDKLKMNWLEDLSKALNNYQIEIVSKVELTENNQPNFKLPEDIYKEMVAKNPNLEKLRIQLGLELK